MGRAIRIDIEQELAAISNGECGACRVGGTHKKSIECYNPGTYKAMVHCVMCGHMFCVDYFVTCPVCDKP